MVDKAKKRLQDLGFFKGVEIKRRPGSAPELAVQRGRVDDAIAAASRALRRATDPAWMAERLQISPAMRPLLTDPRFQALLADHLQG